MLYSSQEHTSNNHMSFPAIWSHILQFYKNKKEFVWFGFICLLVLILSIIVFCPARSGRLLPFFSPTPTPTLVPTSTPTLPPRAPLPSGPQTYKFSHGNQVIGPRPSEFNINKVDAVKGDQQVVSVSVKHTSRVISVDISVETDNEKNVYPLTLTSGTDTDGVWSGSWTFSGDTVNRNYYFGIIAKGSDGSEYSGGPTIR